jgi:hypothetical protein
MGTTNGSGEWAHLAAAFLGKHVDDSGKKLSFTACFNPALESLIVDEAVPLEWRFLLWLYRQSWGNYSDFAIRDKGDEVPLGQKDAAADLGTEKQRISEIVAYWRSLGYLRHGAARILSPADSGINPQKVRTVPDFKRTIGEDFLRWWKVRSVADFEALEVHRAAYFQLIKVRAAAVKEFEALRTSGDPILIEEETKTFNTEEPPSPPPPSLPSEGKAEEEEVGYSLFKNLYPANRLDDAKAKPAFAKLPKKERSNAITGLRLHLDSERWKRSLADNDGKFIPLAAKFLLEKQYAADPPPYIESPGNAMTAGAESEFDRRAKQLQDDLERRKSWPTN